MDPDFPSLTRSLVLTLLFHRSTRIYRLVHQLKLVWLGLLVRKLRKSLLIGVSRDHQKHPHEERLHKPQLYPTHFSQEAIQMKYIGTLSHSPPLLRNSWKNSCRLPSSLGAGYPLGPISPRIYR